MVNLAAQAGVRYSIDHPDVYIESNLIGFYNILEACRHNPVEHLVYASSSSVYGGNKKVPFSTDDKVDNPVSLYAATKKSDELLAHAYSKLYNIPSTGLRFFTVYGPAGRPDMFYYSATQKLVAGKTIQIFNYGNCKEPRKSSLARTAFLCRLMLSITLVAVLRKTCWTTFQPYRKSLFAQESCQRITTLKATVNLSGCSLVMFPLPMLTAKALKTTMVLNLQSESEKVSDYSQNGIRNTILAGQSRNNPIINVCKKAGD